MDKAKCNLEWIAPVDLQDRWHEIREGLNRVNKAGEHWIPEDVYLSVKTGQSHLHIGYIDDEYVGFIVTTANQSYDGVELHIWCTFSNANDFNLLSEVFPEIRKWAENIKAKRITFSSNRPGWIKAAGKLGFRQKMINYEIEV